MIRRFLPHPVVSVVVALVWMLLAAFKPQTEVFAGRLLPSHWEWSNLKLAWESADHLWRWAGDEATDWNHYSKRTILSGILTTQADEVAAAYAEAGMPLSARDDLGDWTTLVVQRA